MPMTPWMTDSLLATANPNSPKFFLINPLKKTVENCKKMVGMVKCIIIAFNIRNHQGYRKIRFIWTLIKNQEIIWILTRNPRMK